MTASLHRLGAGAEAGLYYTNDSEREARPDRRDEYYLADGGGVWWSSGESVVRHGAAIDFDPFPLKKAAPDKPVRRRGQCCLGHAEKASNISRAATSVLGNIKQHCLIQFGKRPLGAPRLGQLIAARKGFKRIAERGKLVFSRISHSFRISR